MLRKVKHHFVKLLSQLYLCVHWAFTGMEYKIDFFFKLLVTYSLRDRKSQTRLSD